MPLLKSQIEINTEFQKNYENLGLITWIISVQKMTIRFYFNDENINVGFLCNDLNSMVNNSPELLNDGWKPCFYYINLISEEHHNQFSKKVKFILEK